MPPVSRKGIVEGALFFAVGMAGMAEALRLSRLPAGLQQTLAPGYYIAGLSALLLVIGLVHMALAGGSSAAQPGGVRPGRMLAMVAVLVAYVAAIPIVGYTAASLAFFIAAFRFFGVAAWSRSILLGLVYTAAFHVVFVVYCEVIFPRPMVTLF